MKINYEKLYNKLEEECKHINDAIVEIEKNNLFYYYTKELNSIIKFIEIILHNKDYFKGIVDYIVEQGKDKEVE